jgi:hypothetical protein
MERKKVEFDASLALSRSLARLSRPRPFFSLQLFSVQFLHQRKKQSTIRFQSSSPLPSSLSNPPGGTETPTTAAAAAAAGSGSEGVEREASSAFVVSRSPSSSAASSRTAATIAAYCPAVCTIPGLRSRSLRTTLRTATARAAAESAASAEGEGGGEEEELLGAAAASSTAARSLLAAMSTARRVPVLPIPALLF